jgi:aspartyl-tRNA(Asn)/glutamyl-tRNA(Gln) amidotransferase subunit B
VEQLRQQLPEKPSIHRKRLQQAWSVPDKEMAAMVNAELLSAVEATVSLGAEPSKARGWWMGEVSRIANERGVTAESLVSPAQIAELVSLVAAGELTDKLARQVVEGMSNQEGSPRQIMAARGLAVVSDDAALMSAIEAAIASQPDTAAKVAAGNLPAAGALIGAVMKATGGQADAARVRELLLKHLGQ